MSLLVIPSYELMLLGFISLLLTVLQGFISRICIPEGFDLHMLPSRLSDRVATPSSDSETEHISGRLKRLLSEQAASQNSYYTSKESPDNKRRVTTIKGIVIARRNIGPNSIFRLGRLVAGVGVESLYPLF